jgi:hypothetical protein
VFAAVAATAAERAAERPGDELVAPAEVVMDRGFTLAAPPSAVWPWLVQLGKRRAGWYLPRRIERAIPPSRRGLRRIEPRWQRLDVGDVIPDYGGRDETFTVAQIVPAELIVYASQRGRAHVTWSIVLAPVGDGCRVLLRLRVAPVKRKWVMNSVGELFDALTIAGLAAGLRERLA